MQKQTIKTTIEIDTQLLYLAKIKAVEERKSLKEIVNESLKRELQKQQITQKKKKIIIGGYKLGGVKGSLRRIDLYEDF